MLDVTLYLFCNVRSNMVKLVNVSRTIYRSNIIHFIHFVKKVYAKLDISNDRRELSLRILLRYETALSSKRDLVRNYSAYKFAL